MFEDHFEELEKICQEAYGGHSELFDNEFLRPMCYLLLELRTAAEVCQLKKINRHIEPIGLKRNSGI